MAPHDQRSQARRATMRDVSARAGVSLATTSRVVNGESTVSAALAARVKAAIEELRYVPDQAARALRRRDATTGTIGFVVDDLANPFCSAVHRAIVDALAAHDLMVLSMSSDGRPAIEREALCALAARHVDGIVLMPTDAELGDLADELPRGTGLVMIDRRNETLAADAVLSDHRDGARRAADHLVQAGHRRIAFLGDTASIRTAVERRAGYESSLRQAAIGVEADLVVMGLRGRRDAYATVIELMSAPDPPTALFAGQNLLTIGAVQALRELGLQRRIALVGFDDVGFADLLDPGLTVVAQDVRAIGSLAADVLLRRLAGNEAAPQTHVVPMRLLARGSGEIEPPSPEAHESII